MSITDGLSHIISPWVKTINVFRACLGAQLTICAQKWRNIVLFSTVSLRFVLSRVCVFLYSLGPLSMSFLHSPLSWANLLELNRLPSWHLTQCNPFYPHALPTSSDPALIFPSITHSHLYTAPPSILLQSLLLQFPSPSSSHTPGAKTINVFRACLSAQLTICAQKWRNFVLFSTVSLRFVLSRVCVFLYSLGPLSMSFLHSPLSWANLLELNRLPSWHLTQCNPFYPHALPTSSDPALIFPSITHSHLYTAPPSILLQSSLLQFPSPSSSHTPGAKTINVFRACLSAQLTICAQKWRNFVLFSTVSLRFVLSRVCVFLYCLGPWPAVSVVGRHTWLLLLVKCF